jgi:hypothetical protein
MSLLSKSVPVFSDVVPAVLIPSAAILAILFGIWTWYRVSAVTVGGTRGAGRPGNGREYLLEEEEQRGEDDVRASHSPTCLVLTVEQSIYVHYFAGLKL